MQMLCFNRVKDYRAWKAVFDAHAHAHREAGLRLVRLWQDADDPEQVYFLLDVEDRARAQAFVDDPVSARAGEEAGVIDGWLHFVEENDEAPAG